MSKMKKIFLFPLAVVFCSIFLSGGALVVEAASDQAISHSYIELIDGQNNNDNSNQTGTAGGANQNTGFISGGSGYTTGKGIARYPQTSELKAMGLSFLGVFALILFLFFYFLRRKKGEE